MKDIVFLEYTFLFDPREAWSNLFEFERDLASFFNERGFEARIIKTVEGQIGKRLLRIEKRKEVEVDEMAQRAGQKSPRLNKRVLKVPIKK